MLALLRLYFKCIIWFIRWGIVAWFVLIPCLMLFGILSPNQEAREALRSAGVNGVPLLIGGSTSAHSASDGSLQKSKQSSYIVVPDSFRHMEIFTYTVSETPASLPQQQMFRPPILPLFLILYIGAGIHTFFLIRRQLRRCKAQQEQERGQEV